jgi:hypothetical protein
MDNRYIIRLLLLTSFCTITKAQTIITHDSPEIWNGRLGDMLIMYTKAKWLAFHYNVPFLYKPFKYSDQFKLHFNEQQFSEDLVQGYRSSRLVDTAENADTLFDTTDNTVYTIGYYFNLPGWNETAKKYDSQEIMSWPEIYTDKQFLRELKKNITPNNPTVLANLPSDSITIAVHIRRGGGFDLPILSHQLYTLKEINPDEEVPAGRYADREWPFKFPPLQYYVDQIKRLSRMMHDAKIYVYIYTDDQDPAAIMNIIATAVNKKNITFDCRKEGNYHAYNVVEDMAAMAQYDCLIRSGSNYPQVSQLMGNHRFVIYPKSCRWIGKNLIINEVGFYSPS